MTPSLIHAALDNEVLVITLQRPDKLNALSSRLIAALMDALAAAEVDDAVAALVITGSGRAFSAGADIAEFKSAIDAGPAHAIRDFVRPGQELTRRIESFRKPIIAAVNGLAYGGGCEIVEATHLAVAATTATFSKAEINIGIIPVFGGTQRLPRHVGRKIALEMILTGEAIDAAEAQARGLINRVVQPERVVAEAVALGATIARKSRSAVSAALGSVQRGLNASIDEGLLIEAMHFEVVSASREAREGVARFVQRSSNRHG